MKRDDLLFPVQILNTNGETLGAALVNGKAVNKTIERKQLWIVHPETGRVLPWQETGDCSSITRDGDMFRAIVQKNVEDGKGFEGRDDAEKKESAVEPDNPVTNTAVDGAIKDSVLTNLEKVILQRKKELPEGSYTTHLFTKGLEKIKKKTGEEAVELILAAEKQEIVYEAADLFYHVLVLLAAQNLSIYDVLKELEKRD